MSQLRKTSKEKARIAKRESEHTRKQWERETGWQKGMSRSNVTIWKR